MYVATPACPALVASVPMTSSASYPGISSMGIRMALSISFIIGTDFLMSSGQASRCALYSGYASWRNVGPAGSKATPMWVGFSFVITSLTVLTNPITAEVLSPFELIRGFFMKA